MFCIFQLNSIGGECGLTNQELAADRRSRPHERARLNGVRCRVLGASFRQWIPRKADWKPRAPGHLKSIRWKLLFAEAVGLQSYRELRRRGVCHNLPGSTVKSAHGPWHLSRSPALSLAMPAQYCDTLGLPRHYAQRVHPAEPPGT